jgi:hypothetical protein
MLNSEIKLSLVLSVDINCCFEEFMLNWDNQVPHWHYLSNEGINFFKGTKGKKYVKP